MAFDARRDRVLGPLLNELDVPDSSIYEGLTVPDCSLRLVPGQDIFVTGRFAAMQVSECAFFAARVCAASSGDGGGNEVTNRCPDAQVGPDAPNLSGALKVARIIRDELKQAQRATAGRGVMDRRPRDIHELENPFNVLLDEDDEEDTDGEEVVESTEGCAVQFMQ
jgi:hypothetical protein